MRKILYLSDVDIGIPGGAQNSMTIIMSELSKDFDFRIITPELSEVNMNNDLKIYELKNFKNLTLSKMTFSKKIIAILKVLFIIKKKRFDIIHVQMPSTMIIIMILKRLKLINKKTKIVYTDRGVFNKYGKITKGIISYSLNNNLIDKVICTTKYNMGLYLSENYDEKKFIHIPNTAGQKYEKINNTIEVPSSKDELNFMFAGRWNIDKNWKLTQDIITEILLNQNQININIVIAYDQKNINDEKEIKNFKKSITNANLKNNKIAFHYNINQSEMNQLYKSNDVFILSSSKESFGRTAVEAMAMKNIVFGTRVDGLEEVIHYEKYLYEDIDEFREKFFSFLHELNKKEVYLSEQKELFFNKYKNEYSLIKNIVSHQKLYNSFEY